MICDEIADFADALISGRPIIGLDLGTKTIGVALSDRLSGFADEEILKASGIW